MSDFAAEMRAARLAQRRVVLLEKAYETRGRAIARAWASRPGGMSWAEFLAAFNDGLPPRARLRTSAVRRDEGLYREVAPDVAGPG